MPILYEDYAQPQVQRFATVKDTEKTLTITLAAGKGVVIDAYAKDEAGAKITKAIVGQKIYVVIAVRNDGDTDYVWFTTKDKDTGTVIAAASYPIAPTILNAGATVTFTSGVLTMPDKNWNLLIEAGHGRA